MRDNRWGLLGTRQNRGLLGAQPVNGAAQSVAPRQGGGLGFTPPQQTNRFAGSQPGATGQPWNAGRAPQSSGWGGQPGAGMFGGATPAPVSNYEATRQNLYGKFMDAVKSGAPPETRAALYTQLNTFGLPKYTDSPEVVNQKQAILTMEAARNGMTVTPEQASLVSAAMARMRPMY